MGRKKLTEEQLAENNRARARAYYQANKEKCKAYQRERAARLKAEDPEKYKAQNLKYSADWRARNPEKRRLVWMKHKYRMTEAQVQHLLDSRGMCESCGLEPATDIDHCHDTGAFRGQLCHGCNAAAGFLLNSPAKAIALAAYLERITHG